MNTRTTHPATYADLQALPDDVVGQIVDGELFTHPRPAVRHAYALGRLFSTLHLGFGKPPGPAPKLGPWTFLPEPELRMDRHVLVPDLAGWKTERLAGIPSDEWGHIVPDWVCEVLSPSNRRLDLKLKVLVYRKFGVRWIWHLDPTFRTLQILSLEPNGYLIDDVFSHDDTARARPFDAIDLRLPELWVPEPEGSSGAP